jgi:hypothetical protein
LSENDTATGDDRYVNDLVVINTPHVNMSTCLEDDAYVVSGDTYYLQTCRSPLYLPKEDESE